MSKILFVCYGNVARSQMAESFYNKYTNADYASSAAADLSAGSKYQHPTKDVVAVMREEGVDVSKKNVKPVTMEMVKDAGRIIVLCDLDDCPRFILDSDKLEHMPIPDPHNLGLEFTRSVRDEIKRIVLDIIQSD
jgi:protein-tyrosine-phosphatase